MNKINWKKVLLLLFVILSVSFFPQKAQANQPIGDTIHIATTEITEEDPKVAYNPLRKEYLVVYWNDRTGCDDIYAQRVSSDGQLLGGFIAIAWGCDADRRYPDVAYNSKHDQYLIVWERKIESQTWIMGKRISGAGEILDDVELEIGSCKINNEPCEKPAVEYAYTSDLYYVVWLINISASDGKFVVGQVVNPDGTMGDPLTFNIISDVSDQERAAPALAYNRHANQHLVVWSEKGIDGYWDIRSHQVTGGGDLLGDEIIIADIANKDCTTPAVAAIPTASMNKKFLIVWEFWYTTAPWDRDVRGRMMTEEGVLSEILILSNSVDDETHPQVAGSESSNKYLVTWSNGHTIGLWSRYISDIGEFLSNQIRTYSPGSIPWNGDVAAGPVGDFLAVWEDEFTPENYHDVYGQLFGLRVYLPFITK